MFARETYSSKYPTIQIHSCFMQFVNTSHSVLVLPLLFLSFISAVLDTSGTDT